MIWLLAVIATELAAIAGLLGYVLWRWHAVLHAVGTSSTLLHGTLGSILEKLDFDQLHFPQGRVK